MWFTSEPEHAALPALPQTEPTVVAITPRMMPRSTFVRPKLLFVGAAVGLAVVGEAVGAAVGAVVGAAVGAAVGDAEGA